MGKLDERRALGPPQIGRRMGAQAVPVTKSVTTRVTKAKAALVTPKKAKRDRAAYMADYRAKKAGKT